MDLEGGGRRCGRKKESNFSAVLDITGNHTVVRRENVDHVVDIMWMKICGRTTQCDNKIMLSCYDREKCTVFFFRFGRFDMIAALRRAPFL